METYEVNKKIASFKTSLDDLHKALNPQKQEEEYKKLNEDMQAPNFWNDTNQAKKVTKRVASIRLKLDTLYQLDKKLKNLIEWFEISEEGSEEWTLLEADMDTFEQELKSI